MIRATCIVLAVSTLACQSRGGQPELTEVPGPIVDILVAASIDSRGHVVDPKLTFNPADPQVTVVVHVGKVTGSLLKLTWYQQKTGGAQKLFEHTVDVSSRDRAFSVGKNPGTLAAGNYKVTATLEGQTRDIRWTVAQQNAAATPGNAPQVQQGQPPASGGSGTIPGPTPNVASPLGQPSGAGTPGLCIGGGNDEGCGDEISDSSADTVLIYVFNESLEVATVKAVVNGVSTNPRTVQGRSRTKPDGNDLSWQLNPCPGGSDLPGTQIQAYATLPSGRTVSTVGTLGADTTLPKVSATFEPPPGTGRKVRGGEEIKITVDATDEKTPGGSWQSGVQAVRVKGPNDWSKEFDVRQQPCDSLKGVQGHRFVYTVPDPPPASFELCAQARDYAKLRAKDSCATFYTALHYWQGTDESTDVLETTDQQRNAKIASTVKSNSRLLVKFSFWPSTLPDKSGKVTLTGEAHAEWRSRTDEVAGPCAGSSEATPDVVSWSAVLSGRGWLSEHPDGSVDVKAQLEAMPSRTEYISTRILQGYCDKSGTGGGAVRANTPSVWGGGRLEVTLANGSFATHTNLRLNAGQTGSRYHDLKIIEIKPSP